MAAAWRYAAQRGADDFVGFDRWQAATIVVPARPTAEEERAARLIQQTLAKASGRKEAAFPITRERAGVAGPRILLQGQAVTAGPKLEEYAAYKVGRGQLKLTAYPAEAIEAAAAWVLERELGARWFMPGTLGEQIPRRVEWRLAPGEASHRPSYISRVFSFGRGEGLSEWGRRNRLRRWFEHGHAMSRLFSAEAMQANPDLQALFHGRRTPPAAGDGNWQPNIASPAAVRHAAGVLQSRPAFSSSISLNDSIRFDQSDETNRLLGEPRWFRLRPDFSPLVFHFANEVAKQVPDRYLGAYAYDWNENTPPFPVEKNVVPYLTADRSEWFDPRFAAEDRALIQRWVRSGAEVVGIYDYYYGAPFLVPRPTLYAVTQAIPFAREAGVRGFYAEVYANWALDGPKAWLAAQLLWDSAQDPQVLLDLYYREFWREAAEPMRAFYALCDEQWRNQPLPSYWIKYFKDEHQALLFPPEVQSRLRALLDQAAATATTDLIRRRVQFVSAGFEVTEAFCLWNETRDRLSRAAWAPETPVTELERLITAFGEQRERLQQTHARIQREYPLAVTAGLEEMMMRSDPRHRARWRILREEARVSGAPRGSELLKDPGLSELQAGPTGGFFDIWWSGGRPWSGYGEPYETRSVMRSPGERPGMAHALVMRGCKQETFSQVVPGEPGRTYVARVKFRGHVSPGNMTFLILNFQDAQGKTLSYGIVDRVPVGRYDVPVELLVQAEAPDGAAWIGLGVRVMNQVENDVAEFSDFSLREWERAGGG